MTIKVLLFCLFLYVCLVWVGAYYFYAGAEAQHFGLQWTAVGLIAILVFIIGARLFGWWRLWRARAAARPAAAPAAQPAAGAADQGDESMVALIATANAALAKVPAYSGRGPTPLSGLPLYLLVGPAGSGKTSTFINSGVEPQLLAGQVTGTTAVVSTRLANIWLAKNTIFVEIGGLAFSGDLGQWTRLLRPLRGGASVPMWRRLLKEPPQGMQFRGVIGFCESKEFSSAAADPQKFERYSRDWQERLRSIAEVFGAGFPVYQIVTKCDKIPFYTDFFHRLPETDVNQIFGCTVSLARDSANPGEVFAEAEARRLTASFRPLYQAVAARRLSQLAHEPDRTRRPSVYEFPRELKRIRSPLVQFLTDVFRPSLGYGPVLRGYYLTGVREGEIAVAEDVGATRVDLAPNLGLAATQLFRGDATQMLQAGGADLKVSGVGMRRPMGQRWMFVADVFHKVVLQDQPLRATSSVANPVDRYRQIALAAVGGLCALLCLAFFISWIQNRQLVHDVSDAAGTKSAKHGRLATLGDLQSLEALRVQLVRLEDGLPLSYHWGLYTGNRILDRVRTAYFRRFQELLLIDLNGQMVAEMEGLPASPGANAPYDPVYRVLKTHLMITSGSCAPEPAYAAKVLKEKRAQIAANNGSEWQALADRQIDFYAAALPGGNLPRLPEDTTGRDRARQYLQQAKGVDRAYAGIIASAEKNIPKTNRLTDLAPNYAQVLAGPAEVNVAFSRDGWTYVEKASKQDTTLSAGDACVVGQGGGVVGELKQSSETAQAIQRLYFRDYVEQWRRFVEAFSVARYAGPDDAARKLEILSDHRSPLLAVLALTSNQTNFPQAPGQVEAAVEKIPVVSKLLGLKKAASDAKAAVVPQEPPDALNSPADVTRSFQPVQWVEPPGSDTWVVDKNAAYMDALAQLRRSMQDIAQSARNPDPAVYQAASQNYDKAMDTVRQLSRGFKAVGVGKLDETVENLLEQPIRLTKPFIVTDLGKAGADKVNRELRTFCTSERNMLHEFPFQWSSSSDASLDEVSGMLDPAKGALWRFQAQSLADFVVKDGTQWKSKDPAKKPQVTQEMLAFLNRAQSLVDVFYPAGATQPHINYTLRPKLDSRFKDSILELEVDGQLYPWTTSLQKQFTWPSAAGVKDLRAVARIKTGSVAFAFASRPGVWGIFRIMGDAEPRTLGTKTVEWKYSSGGLGSREPIQPAPVDLDIVSFPGGQDVFNSKFWDGLQCPSAAVQ